MLINGFLGMFQYFWSYCHRQTKSNTSSTCSQNVGKLQIKLKQNSFFPISEYILDYLLLAPITPSRCGNVIWQVKKLFKRKQKWNGFPYQRLKDHVLWFNKIEERSHEDNKMCTFSCPYIDVWDAVQIIISLGRLAIYHHMGS